MISFEWDVDKNKNNQRKHGISFDEAKSVFYDEYAIQFYDENHSDTEDRFIMLGLSTETRLLLVCHCERNQGQNIRIISARKATKTESKYYKGDDL